MTTDSTTQEKTIEQQLVELARARRDCAAQGAILATMIAELEARPEYQTASELQKRYKATVEELTEAIKQQAVNLFDGENKTITPGVKIQERTQVTIIDADAAMHYAFNFSPGMVKLDTTAMSRLATQLAGTPHALPFCDVRKALTATIATDLDKIVIDSNIAF